MSSKRANSDLVIKRASRGIDVRRYAAFVGDLKRKIIETGHRVGQSVNRELVLLYWNIGRGILTARSARAGAQGHPTAWLLTQSSDSDKGCCDQIHLTVSETQERVSAESWLRKFGQ